MDYRQDPLQQEIDGLVYTSTKLDAAEGWSLLPRLVRLLGHGALQQIITGDIASTFALLLTDADAIADRMDGEDPLKVETTIAAARKSREQAAANAAYMLDTIAERAERVSLSELAMRVLRGVECGRLRPIGSGPVAGDPAVFGRHFSGEYLHLLRVMAFAIRHNYAGPTLGSLSMSGSPGGRRDGSGATAESSTATSAPGSPT